MTSDRPSKLFPDRKVEKDDGSLTKNGELGNGEYIGIADRNAGVHLRLEEIKHGDFTEVVSNFKGKITALFVPPEIEERALFKGGFELGAGFTSADFNDAVKKEPSLKKNSTMLFYGKSLVNVKLLNDEEKQILVNRYPYYKNIFPSLVSEESESSSSERSKGIASLVSEPKARNRNMIPNEGPNELDKKAILKKLDAEFTEGEAIQTVVNSKRRNTAVVKLLKELAKSKDGLLRCACCSFEMQTAFGFDYIEAAHRFPLSQRPKKYKLEDPENDLFHLCPNCHVAYDRLEHVNSVKELKAAIRVKFKWVKEEE